MPTQWYLCEIDKYPKDEESRLKPHDNLLTTQTNIFASEGDWLVWLPIIPRVGDTLQFSGWQVQVSRVILRTDWVSQTGIKENVFVSAWISIRDDVVPTLMDSHFAVESRSWEDFARRGNDLQYYAWELKHESYLIKDSTGGSKYYRWHTRIRPIAGDIILVKDKRWQVDYVELSSANDSIDGWLTLSPTEVL